MWKDSEQGGGSLSSGLDDYPRRIDDKAKFSVHVDLQSWMAYFTRFMHVYTKQYGDEES